MALRETLDGQRLASRYGWISGRLMVLRNLVIATAVLSAVLISSMLLLHEGRPAEAERAARQVVDAAAGTNPYTLELLARAVAAQGRVDEALLLLLREARSRFPTFCPLHDSAATLLLQAGRQQQVLVL